MPASSDNRLRLLQRSLFAMPRFHPSPVAIRRPSMLYADRHFSHIFPCMRMLRLLAAAFARRFSPADRHHVAIDSQKRHAADDAASVRYAPELLRRRTLARRRFPPLFIFHRCSAYRFLLFFAISVSRCRRADLAPSTADAADTAEYAAARQGGSPPVAPVDLAPLPGTPDPDGIAHRPMPAAATIPRGFFRCRQRSSSDARHVFAAYRRRHFIFRRRHDIYLPICPSSHYPSSDDFAAR